MTRYAIYFAPAPDTALWHFGSSVLGYDAQSGQSVPHPKALSFPLSRMAGLTETPRRYGFHATLKAPFYLRDNVSGNDLIQRAEDFANAHTALLLGKLTVTSLGNFIALAPAHPTEALDAFAFTCVRELDDLRAPLTEPDRQRRLASGLTPRQRNLLEQFGYPYVGDEFRFHMTLTGRLAAHEQDAVLDSLRQLYAGIDKPVTLDAIAIARQESAGARFTVIQRLPLKHRVA